MATNKSRIACIAAAFLAAGAQASGAIANCNNSSTPAAYGTNSTPAIGTGTTAGTIEDPNNSYTAGTCKTVDVTFSNFSESGYSIAGSTGGTHSEGPDPTVTGTYVATNGTAISFLTTDTSDTTQNWTVSAVGGSTTSSHADLTEDVFFGATTSTTVIGEVSVVASWGAIHQTGGGSSYTATVELLICPGVTTFTAGCTGEQMVTTANGGSNSNVIATILLSTPVTSIAVEDIVTIDAFATSGNTVNITLDSFTDAINPEPSTFVLLATGIAAVAFLRRRRIV